MWLLSARQGHVREGSANLSSRWGEEEKGSLMILLMVMMIIPDMC